MGCCKFIWAKASQDPTSDAWLSLDTHLHDTMGVSERLWHEWVPKHTRSIISSGISGCDASALDILKFLSASHDLGKATPVFQRKDIEQNHNLHNLFINHLKNAGLSCNDVLTDVGKIPHSLASEIILERNGIPRCLAIIIGSHHGVTPTKEDLDDCNIDGYCAHTGFNDEKWTSVQESLLSYALSISNVDLDDIKKVNITQQSQVLLSSLVIMSDWIASNDQWFPLISDKILTDSEIRYRLDDGWNLTKILHTWNNKSIEPSTLFEKRFSYEPRPFQKKLIEAVSTADKPGIIVIEAPMGEGKTEAALVAAEIISNKYGMGGIFFGLPTQATANGIFPRIVRWIESTVEDSSDRNSIFLAHGKSRFNEKFTSMEHIGWNNQNQGTSGAVIHEWFTGKKKGLLSDFVIGTVDHVLMGGLKLKHLALRHLGLANKVIIIDECHAYDSYMGSYLVKVIKWLGSYNVPVIIMSATLYPSRREELINAYLGKNVKTEENAKLKTSTQYPSIIMTDGIEIKQYCCESSSKSKDVSIIRIDDSNLLSVVKRISANGGYIGIICNTVDKSQKIYRQIHELFPNNDVYLLHSRFTSQDRSRKEAEVISLLSKEKRKEPPYCMIVVGTQVMEQSLDLDFDVIITDLCPTDLFLQRIGRLHRHSNVRPNGLEKPTCYVIDEKDDFDKGSLSVYNKYQLYNARLLIGDKVTIPTDIPKLVHMAYSDTLLKVNEEITEDYRISFDDVKKERIDKEQRAKTFQIKDPKKDRDIVDWLKNNARDDSSGNIASATVRDTEGSIEVILVTDNEDGSISAISEGISIRMSKDATIDEKTAFSIAGCKIALPSFFVRKRMSSTIAELSKMTSEHIPECWRSNGWLKDELFLVSKPDGKILLDGIKMRYSFEEGLVVLK